MLGIGNFDKVNKRKVKTREDQVMFLGKKYQREKTTRVLCVYLWGAKEASCGYVGSGAWGSPGGVCGASY